MNSLLSLSLSHSQFLSRSFWFHTSCAFMCSSMSHILKKTFEKQSSLGPSLSLIYFYYTSNLLLILSSIRMFFVTSFNDAIWFQTDQQRRKNDVMLVIECVWLSMDIKPWWVPRGRSLVHSHLYISNVWIIFGSINGAHETPKAVAIGSTAKNSNVWWRKVYFQESINRMKWGWTLSALQTIDFADSIPDLYLRFHFTLNTPEPIENY